MNNHSFSGLSQTPAERLRPGTSLETPSPEHATSISDFLHRMLNSCNCGFV